MAVSSVAFAKNNMFLEPLFSENRIGYLLQTAAEMLHQSGISNYQCEARWLLEKAAGFAAGDMFFHLSQECSKSTIETYQSWLDRRCQGEPLQHILGTTDFFGYELKVGPGVLIPRPETEVLAELALHLYPGTGMICDLCTGCGGIALTLACELANHPLITGCDVSDSALAYAIHNKKLHQADNLHFFQGDLLSPLRDNCRFSMITANPPYVSAAEYANLPAIVRDFDPPLALVSENQGLAMIYRVIMESRNFLQNNGLLLCEIGENQGETVKDMMEQNDYASVRIEPDLSGRPRIAVGYIK